MHGFQQESCQGHDSRRNQPIEHSLSPLPSTPSRSKTVPDMLHLRPAQLYSIIFCVFAAITIGAYLVWNFGLLQKAPEQSRPVIEAFMATGLPAADPANCIACHREETEAWMHSHHALANAPLNDEDRKRLNQSADALLQERGMRWQSQGGVPVLQEPGLEPYPVIGSIGIEPLIQYLHLAPDGRIQAHDVAWDVEKEEWFTVFEGENDPTPRTPGEWGHWSGQGMNWDANCAYCHMTEYHKGYDIETDTYNRQWAHMGITCAQCHGEMDVHLDQIANGKEAFYETYSPEQIMESCATCHSRREELTREGFRPGDQFEDHYQLTLADIPDLYHPDGQVIGENYVYGSLMMSSMGHAGVTCMDCHDPHTNANILPTYNNALCMRCHSGGLMDAPKIIPTAHSHHPAGSTGNQCIECHMPVTHFMGRDGRRDHSFSNPDPTLSIEMGIPNACTECHNTQSNEWAKQHTDVWYGEDMNAERREKARLIHAVFGGQTDTAARLRAAVQNEENRFWKATFVSLLRYLPPDALTLDLLKDAALHSDPMVRSAAVRTAGLDAFSQSVQEDLLADPSRSVRIAASLASSDLRVHSDTEESELRAYMEHTSDSPMGALRYAAYLRSRGELDKAALAARRAVQREPLNAEAWRLAAIELHSSMRSTEALQFLDKALSLDRSNSATLFNIGLLQYELGNADAALDALHQAVQIDPRNESAWYNLIVLYMQLQDPQTARQTLLKALEANPYSQRLQSLSR
jgi:predicted CXXCH cytochrome family protein